MPPPRVPASKSSPIKISAPSYMYHKLQHGHTQSSEPVLVPNAQRQYLRPTDDGVEYQMRANDLSYQNEQATAMQYTPLMSGALPVQDPCREPAQPGLISRKPGLSNTADEAESRAAMEQARNIIPGQVSHTLRVHDNQYSQTSHAPDATDRIRSFQFQPDQHSQKQSQRTPAPALSWSETAQARQDGQSGFRSPGRASAAPNAASSFFVQQRQNRSGRPYTPSPQKHNTMPSVDPSVSSPFFRPSPSVGHLGTQSGLYTQPVFQGSALPNINQGYRMPSTQRTPVQTPQTQSHSLNGLSFNEHPYSMTAHEPLYRRQTGMTYQHRLASFVPQTPRDMDGFFTRPGLGPPSSSHHYQQPQPLPSIQPSLAPSIYAPQRRNWPNSDEALNVVKGAKSVGTSVGRSGLSAVSHGIRSNGRRSVRR